MFKKSNRNFRAKRNDSDEEDADSNSNEVVIVKTKPLVNIVANEVKKTTPAVKATILSFDLEGEGEEVEAFKIKKSKESRRMTKEKKKERKHPTEEKTEKPTKDVVASEKKPPNEDDDVILFNDEIKLKPLKQTHKLDEGLKNLTFKSDSLDKFRGKKKEKEEESEDEEEKIRKLREEIEILNGDQEDYENETDEQKRSMKILLKTGHIPDSNMIHEARKKREMARQGDYMPLNTKNVELKGPKSRLIREDENDIDEDDECYSFDILEKSNKEKQQTRENFLAYEQGSDSEDEDNNRREVDDDEDDEDQWEKDQIRKGVGITQIINMKKSNNIDTTILEKYVGYTLESLPMDLDVKPEIQLNNLPKVTFESVQENIRANSSSFDETYRAHLNERKMALMNLESSRNDLEKLKKEKPVLNDQYTFYQEMRLFVADLIDCYNEKLADIEKLESKWLNLMKERASRVMSRRQLDIKDQNAEYSIIVSQGLQQDADFKRSLDAVHQRRLADRDLRRSRRKQLRESSNEQDCHYDGLSSDDDDTPSNLTIFNQKRSDIIGRAPELFEDVNEDFYSVDSIKSKFEEWRLKYSSSYEDAYVSLSLPKLFSPLVRFELIDWNPLETGINDFQNKKWLQSLKTYHNPSVLVNEDDKILVPRIIEKTIFNKLIELIENVYDPFSTKQTQNLASLVKLILNEYPTLNSSNQNTQKLLNTVEIKIRKTFDNDVFVPLFPKAIIDDKANCSSIFFYRQFWSCVKLMSNIIDWHGVLSNQVVQELSLNSLLNRYIMVALQYMELNMETVTKIEFITRKFPKKWFESLTSSQTIPQLSNLCRLLLRIVDNFKNQMDQSIADVKLCKENIRIIRKVFVSVQAMDHAIDLTNKFQIK